MELVAQTLQDRPGELAGWTAAAEVWGEEDRANRVTGTLTADLAEGKDVGYEGNKYFYA